METTQTPEIELKITLPSDLFKLLETQVPAEQYNQFFANLLERELQRQNFRQAWAQSAGAWSAEDHPELQTAKDIEAYVRGFRENDVSRNWDDILAEGEDD